MQTTRHTTPASPPPTGWSGIPPPAPFTEAGANTRLPGSRHSTGWAKDQKLFFAAEFSKPFKSFELKGENNMFGRVNFDTDSAEQILVKVAISPVSVEGAKANLAAEMPGWDFDATRKAAGEAWNKELNKVKIETPDADARKKFYTALYHTMLVLAPCSGATGQDRG